MITQISLDAETQELVRSMETDLEMTPDDVDTWINNCLKRQLPDFISQGLAIRHGA